MKESIAIELHNLTVTYDSKPALWNVDYTIPEGVMAGIIGPNGSGKTTMIKSIMGLIEPSSGYCKIFEKDFADVRQRISYVPQRSSIDWNFPATVLDIVLMGRYQPQNIFKRLSSKDKKMAWEALEKVEMQQFANRQIGQLSGGQQQRVFLARALAQQSDLYILDEPFVGVDVATEQAIVSILHEMRREKKTILVVHHDLQTVQQYFDWLVFINTRLVNSGKTEEVFTTDNLTDTYGGKLNILSEVGELLKKHNHPIRESK